MRLTPATTAAAAASLALAIAAPPVWARPELNATAASASSNAEPARALDRQSEAVPFGSSTGASAPASFGGTRMPHPGTTTTHTTTADLIAAQRAAASPSASLNRFALINVRNIPAIPSGDSNPERFHFGDAAIGAGVTAGLVLLGIAGLLVARRRREPLHT